VVVSLYLFLFGLIIGSFYNVCIFRLPKNQDIFLKQSSCPHCKKKLKWLRNIPVLSFLLLTGQCSYCKKKISLQYPLVEILTGCLALFGFVKYGLTLNAFLFFIFGSSLIIIFFTDFNEYLILDVVTLPLTLIGVLITAFVINPFDISPEESISGLLIGFTSFYLIRWFFLKYKKIEAMGFGDVKLMMMIGAWLGLKSILFVMLISSVTALFVAIPLTIVKKNKRYPIPYGCFITIAAFLYILLGDSFYKLLI